MSTAYGGTGNTNVREYKYGFYHTYNMTSQAFVEVTDAVIADGWVPVREIPVDGVLIILFVRDHPY